MKQLALGPFYGRTHIINLERGWGDLDFWFSREIFSRQLNEKRHEPVGMYNDLFAEWVGPSESGYGQWKSPPIVRLLGRERRWKVYFLRSSFKRPKRQKF